MSFSPRVVGAHSADFASLQALLASPPFAGKSGEALVLAIYDYFTSSTLGTYHFWPVDEIAGEPRRRSVVFDPLKMINCYGWMICGQCSAFLYNLYRAAGFPARQIGVPGHSLCEVFYDDRWHILDVDMWTWFRTPAGHIASAYELAKNPHALIVENQNRSNPCSLPDRPVAGHAEMYAACETVDDHVKSLCPVWKIAAHTMDFHLRPGETLVRSQTSQGRFLLPESWRANFEKYKKEWKGEPRERYEPFRTYGNGRWHYAPDLSAASRDFEFAVWERSGLTQNNRGLVGPGQVTIRLQSPYPFCAVPDAAADKFTYHDGITLALSGRGGCRAEIDTVEGGWQQVMSVDTEFHVKCDLSPHAQSRYDCLLRITLEPGARLEEFLFDASLMTAPGSLPHLVEGANPMTVHQRDKFGRATVPWSRLIDFRAAADPIAQAVQVVNGAVQPYVPGWLQLAPQSANPVTAIYRFDAPAGRRFAWFYGQASLREGPQNEPARTATLHWSTDGETWQPLAAHTIPNTPLQWDTAIDGEAQLPAPGATVYLKVTSGTALSACEFHGHLDVDGQAHPAPLQIVHRWREGPTRSLREFRAPAATGSANAPRSYEFTCAGNPRDHTIEMNVPSLPKT